MLSIFLLLLFWLYTFRKVKTSVNLGLISAFSLFGGNAFIFSERADIMTKLDIAREEICAIDKEMARLFEKRMNAAKNVAEYKKENGLPVFDAEREGFLIEHNSSYIQDGILKDYYVEFLKSTMDISKAYQRRLLDGMRVAYSGVPGAFAHIAVTKIFESAMPVSYGSFKDAYEAVGKGECDCAVLPVENSFQGDVAQVMDLAFFGTLHITGIYDLEVSHNLLAKKGTNKGDIKKVISHAQALGQCAEYIEKNNLAKEECTNTAVAAKTVAESEQAHIAAIASKEAAKLYGLSVIEENINESRNNTTRFAVFSRSAGNINKENNRFVLFFTVKNEAGALGRAISVIGKYGFNLKALKSRPTKELIWDYYFFAEGEGDIAGENGEKMLLELKESCNEIKVSGCFANEERLGK